MKRYVRTLCVLCAALVLTVGLGSVTSAAPLYGRPLHSPEPIESDSGTSVERKLPVNAGSNTSSGGDSATAPMPIARHPEDSNTNESTAQTSATVKEHLQANQLKFCDDHATIISTIMDNASTRAQNQITLFANIATRVENFYTSKGKTITTYNQLVAAVNSAESQAKTDLATLQSSGVFSCDGNNPGGIISTYRSNLKTVQTDMQNLRTAVRNLIVAVAQAEGFTLSKSATEGGQ